MHLRCAATLKVELYLHFYISIFGVVLKRTAFIFNMRDVWVIELCCWVKSPEVSKDQSFYLQPAAVQSPSAA
jgi:hypothetical protein